MLAAFFVITGDFSDGREDHIVLVLFLAEYIWGVNKN